jgi:site-specific DNA-cytosine methylase
MKHNRWKALSLFDGIGGVRKAAQIAELPIDEIDAVEVDPFAKAVATKGNKSNKIQIKHIEGNINNIPTLKGQGYHFIAGGAPCQDLSAMNWRGKGLEGEKSGLAKKFYQLIDSAFQDDPELMHVAEQVLTDKIKNPDGTVQDKTWTEYTDDLVSDLYGEPYKSAMINARHYSPISRKRTLGLRGFPHKVGGEKKADMASAIRKWYDDRKRKEDDVLNPLWNGDDILNIDLKEGQEIEDFDDLLTRKGPIEQDKWHFSTPWGGTPLATHWRKAFYPSDRANEFQNGLYRPIVKYSDKGHLIYDPDKKYSHLIGKVAPSGQPYGILQKPAGNMADRMIPGETYESRYYTPEEVELFMGWDVGHTKLPIDVLQPILDKILWMKKKFGAHMPEYGSSEFLQLPKDMQDIATWLDYTDIPGINGQTGKIQLPVDKIGDAMRFHNVGNGWHVKHIGDVLRRAQGLPSLNDRNSDSRLKNIISAVRTKY